MILGGVLRIFAHFDFGPSFVYKDRDVNEIIAQGFPVTLYYGAISFVVAVLAGVALGIAAAITTVVAVIGMFDSVFDSIDRIDTELAKKDIAAASRQELESERDILQKSAEYLGVAAWAGRDG